jgi:DNA-directed RNA polymerase specialized sigma24 family protein
MTTESYGQAYQAGFHRTVGFLLSQGLRGDCARDIAQAAWVRGWERLDQLRSEGMVLTWVNSIALNLYRHSIRSDRANQRALKALPDSRTAAGPDLAAIDLRRLLTFCRPCDRLLLERQMRGASAEEMAQELGVSNIAIRIRLLRARRSVRMAAETRRMQLVQANDFALRAKEVGRPAMQAA